jgi:hypothetical protein
MSMFEPTFALLWKGGLHFGDEPGIFDDAHFVGLVGEWPLTVRKLEPNDGRDGAIALRLEAENINILGTSPGHLLTVVRFEPRAQSNDRWRRSSVPIIGSNRLSSNAHEFVVAIPRAAATVYLGLRLEVDTSVAPGLLNDFVVRRLDLKSTTHYSSFGFHFDAAPAASKSDLALAV